MRVHLEFARRSVSSEGVLEESLNNDDDDESGKNGKKDPKKSKKQKLVSQLDAVKGL